MQFSCQQTILRVVLVVLVIAIVGTYARPASSTSQNNDARLLSRRIVDLHARSSARKRHAEIRLQSEITRKMQEMRRIRLLNNIMSGLDTSNTYSVKKNTGQDVPPPTTQAGRDPATEIYPSIASSRDMNPQQLQRLNGQILPGGVKLRIIGTDNPPPTPVSAYQFRSYIRNSQNALATARSCRDMQKMVAMNNLRIRVRCQSSTSVNNRTYSRRVTS